MKLAQSDETTYTFQVQKVESEERLDKYITLRIGWQTRSQVQIFIINSQVYLNNSIEKNCSKKVKTGDSIVISITNKRNTLNTYNLKLDTIFEDEHLMVINKPPGLAVYPGKKTNNKTLVNALISYSKNLSSTSGDNRPGIVHRLDRGTSGLMLVAKDDETHLHLSDQIKGRKVKRRYLTLTYGVPNPVVGHIITNLAKCKKDHTKIRVVNNNSGKTAITNYRVINIYENGAFSLVQCELGTGRTHQIRVHMKFKNTPIVGDPKYSLYYSFNPKLFSKELVSAINVLSRQALHAHKISFFHPKSLKLLSFEIPMERDVQKILNLLKVDNFEI